MQVCSLPRICPAMLCFSLAIYACCNVNLIPNLIKVSYRDLYFWYIFFKLMISICDTCTHTLVKSLVFPNTLQREPMKVMHVTTKHIHERITLLTKRYTACFMIYNNLVYAIYILEVHHPHDVSCRLVGHGTLVPAPWASLKQSVYCLGGGIFFSRLPSWLLISQVNYMCILH